MALGPVARLGIKDRTGLAIILYSVLNKCIASCEYVSDFLDCDLAFSPFATSIRERVKRVPYEKEIESGGLVGLEFRRSFLPLREVIHAAKKSVIRVLRLYCTVLRTRYQSLQTTSGSYGSDEDSRKKTKDDLPTNTVEGLIRKNTVPGTLEKRKPGIALDSCLIGSNTLFH